MRPLLIGPATREQAERIVAYAQAHPYVPGPGVPPPGDDPNHVGVFDSYRCAFSFTHADNGVFRHLSISVPSGKLPNPFAAYALAEIFGFTGWDGGSVDVPDSWMVGMSEEPVPCVIIAQPVVRETVH